MKEDRLEPPALGRPTLFRENAMSRFIGVSLAAGLALLVVAGAASAQSVPPSVYNRPNVGVGSRPQLPPFLNLNNNDPAVNYFLRTLPEQERRANTQVYGALIGDLEQRALTPTVPAAADADLFRTLPTTGHPVAFQNTGGYFPTSGRPATGGGYQAPARR
ncbi:MAG TPA: hypothetical protein DDY78_15200 [Planctomycetales bacterium]|nr:hypothetical protein [Planctomycetales bacterium]